MERLALPKPHLDGALSVEQVIARRRTRRELLPGALMIEEFAQLLWAAQGVTDKEAGKRTVPSAGAMHPLVIYAAVGEDGVEGVQAGVYRYEPDGHCLEGVLAGDVRADLMGAGLDQWFLGDAPVILLVAGEFGRATERYGQRGARYVDMEAGHAGQNILLQAESLALAAVAAGAFRDGAVARVFGLPKEHAPLYLVPIGHPKPG
jgi:SagB-type dehydrogenase family enzyme